MTERGAPELERVVQLRPRLRDALARGWRRRCPRCGEGPLFRRWIETYERCSVCHLVYQRDHGNTLMFMIVTDRIPLLLGIAALYFGFRATNWVGHAAFLGLLAAPLLATLRQRQGLALALDYMAGLYMGESSSRPPSAGTNEI
jgi:uncharacterized protein (DUF983 family)